MGEVAELENPVEWIARKRAGGSLSARDISRMIAAYTSGRMPDYQMSAWLMAAVLKGLNQAETVALTDAMLRSGARLPLKSVKQRRVDKHSTGGIGDKVSICLAPWVAACGVAVPMIAGRGLGYTGGTLDKLESIAGYSTRLDPRAFERVLGRVGASIIGQSAAIAPADGKMYALRDVTATVDYIPLIVASILSKKLACAADALVMDVKCGRGAFMKSRREAVALARSLVQVGSRFGRRVVALVTQMNTPLGRTIGNALEVAEAIDVLRGRGPDDTTELTRALAVEMLLCGSVTRKRQHAEELLSQKLQDGSALAVFKNMITAHGGDARVVDDPARLPRSKCRIPVTSSNSGYVRDINAGELGRVAFELGAGRVRVDQGIDHAVGVEIEATLRSRVKKGQVLAWLHVQKAGDAVRATHTVRNAFTLGSTKPSKQRLILERIGS